MDSIRRSIILSFAGRYTIVAVQFASTVILARLLTPEDIGIYSVGVALVGIAQTLRDFGLTNYLIQEKELTLERRRTAFTMMLVLSWTLASVIYLARNVVADFYQEPGIRDILAISSFSFVLLPFGSLPFALMRREMKFAAITQISVLSAVVQAATGIALAFAGFGFMSLAWSSLASAASSVVLACAYYPDLRSYLPGFQDIRRIGSFASKMSATAILTELGLVAPDLVIGRTLGFAALGYFSRAMGVVNLFTHFVVSAIFPVLLPALTQKIRRNEPITSIYISAVAMLTVLAWPFYLFVAIWAGTIIDILYGSQWLDAAPLARTLCLSAIIAAPTAYLQQAITATGKVGYNLRLQLIHQPIQFLLIGTAAFHSIEMVATAHLVSSALYCCLSSHMLRTVTGIDAGAVMRGSSRSLAVTGIAVLPPLAMASVPLPFSDALLMLASGCASAVCWLLAVFLFRHRVSEELKTLREHTFRFILGLKKA